MKPISEAWVFVDMPGEKSPVLAGRLALRLGEGLFVYGKSYLQRPDRFALDPLNLPLLDRTQVIHGNDGVPAALLDSGPDNWGRRLMHALHTRHPQNKLEELLATKGSGVGAIRVSLSRTSVKGEPNYAHVSSLTELNDNVQALMAEGKITPELLKQLEPGSSMGGARPKSVVIDDDGNLHLAKFSRPDDVFDQSKAEEMCYLMAREAGITTADTYLTTVAGRSVIMVKRFDTVEGESYRRHFVSANALMYQPRVRAAEVDHRFSYPQLAETILKIGSKDDLEELFRRMVFNVAVGNTDDHLRNHGFLKNLEDNEYRLSPAYDVVPQPGADTMQAIGLGGPDGRLRSLHSCLSSCRYFGLSESHARAIIDEVISVTRHWRDFAERVCLLENDQAILSNTLDRFAEPKVSIDYAELALSLDKTVPETGLKLK